MSKRKTKGTKAWTEREARRMLAEQRSSGLTIGAFAKKRGLVAERLYWWRRKLEAPRRIKAGASRRSNGKAGAMPFVEVTGAVATEAAKTIDREPRFEVVLAHGRRVWVPGGFAADDMRRLVAVLEDAPC